MEWAKLSCYRAQRAKYGTLAACVNEIWADREVFADLGNMQVPCICASTSKSISKAIFFRRAYSSQLCCPL